LFEDFAVVLATPDCLLLTEVYAAGETPIAGADGRSLCRAIRARGQVDPVFVEEITDVQDALGGVLHDDDVLLMLGAGDIGGVAATLAEHWPECA
jgi:UDP-N-acetylmuramate--alanine ligase